MFTFIYSAEGQALGLLWSLNSVQLRLNLSICKMKRAVLCCFGIVHSLAIYLCIVLIFAGVLKNGSDNELPGVLFCDSILLWNFLLRGFHVFGWMALSWRSWLSSIFKLNLYDQDVGIICNPSTPCFLFRGN